LITKFGTIIAAITTGMYKDKKGGIRLCRRILFTARRWR
jgi:hypothetical protein